MALYAVEGYKVPGDLAADPYAAEKDSVADKLSAYYGSDVRFLEENALRMCRALECYLFTHLFKCSGV
jgi:hypothetical protein